MVGANNIFQHAYKELKPRVMRLVNYISDSCCMSIRNKTATDFPSLIKGTALTVRKMKRKESETSGLENPVRLTIPLCVSTKKITGRMPYCSGMRCSGDGRKTCANRNCRASINILLILSAWKPSPITSSYWRSPCLTAKHSLGAQPQHRKKKD